MIADSIKAQLDEAEHVIRAQMARIAELEVEVERLKANADAHQTLRNIYANPAEPTGHRIKAAIGCLPHEVPKLLPERAALELSPEPIIPLADLVTQRRQRQSFRASLLKSCPTQARLTAFGPIWCASPTAMATTATD